MEQKLVISSQRAREIDNKNKPSDFVTVFDRPIILHKNKQYLIGLDKVNTMTYSWHNVGPDYNNNIIGYIKRVYIEESEEYEYRRTNIEFPSVTYDYFELSDYIEEILIINGELQPDEKSPITTEFNLTRFIFIVSIRVLFALDLRGSNFGSFIEYEPKVIKETEYGSKLPNITNSLDALYIHCDLVNESIVDGIYSDVIHVVSTVDLTRSYTFKDELLRVGYCIVNKTIIK